ncbi:hypothetical protein [Streptomyces sp. SAJ15]|uniref:hypothetical protein n=1 Tax=Streptomyces sp. SAJ15 TaxID=2011095 RepID=UPI001184FA91|nr:hypothetical protein [Streptomyces sp. SAJ15]TVL93777.1 hypothetical protein CD790_01630 [Streptomyces sp. SAJ15]
MSEENRLRALPTESVGKRACDHCRARPMKLPGLSGGLCIACYAAERLARPRQTGLGQSACFVSDPCMGCGSEEVDANGWEFWCDCCGMRVAVANPPGQATLRLV